MPDFSLEVGMHNTIEYRAQLCAGIDQKQGKARLAETGEPERLANWKAKLASFCSHVLLCVTFV